MMAWAIGLFVCAIVGRQALALTPAPAAVMTPPSGAYASPLMIKITCPAAGASIRYTWGGNTPTELSALYTQPLVLKGAPGTRFTVKARVFQAGFAPSAITSQTYTIAPPPARIYVDSWNTNGPWIGTFEKPLQKIQDAIAMAGEGTEIICARARYNENINFGGKNVILRSRDPQDMIVIKGAVIDGGQRGPAVTFKGTETAACRISGFTITNGKSAQGGGIRGNGTRATIERNVIINNSGYGLNPSNPSIYLGVGGGLYGCDGRIQNNIIAYNRAFKPGGIAVGTFDGGALYQCNGEIFNNTILGHMSEHAAVALCRAKFLNNIIWFNDHKQIDAASSASVSGCDIQDFDTSSWVNTGNISLDPLFVDPVREDFRLKSESPCIDAGRTVAGLKQDIGGLPRPFNSGCAARGDGSGMDIGAHECQTAGLSPAPAIYPVSANYPVSAEYASPLVVTMANFIPGTVIRYTDDGSIPTATSPVYTGPLTYAGPRAIMAIRARAFNGTAAVSPVTIAAYQISGPNYSYVDQGNTAGPWDGTSAHPWRGVNEALARASFGSVIYVAKGDYQEVINLKSGVKLLGGFPRGSFDLAKRDPGKNLTHLIGANLVSIREAALDGFFVFSGNVTGVANVIECKAIDRSCVIGNSIIGYTYAAMASPHTITVEACGIYCDNASPVIRNCSIDSLSGGFAYGIKVDSGSPLIESCVIRNIKPSRYWVEDYQTWWGKGAGVVISGSPLLRNCVINNVTSANGAACAGITMEGNGQALIQNCTIQGNTVGINGPGAIIQNTILWNNTTQILAISWVPTFSCIQGWKGGGSGNISADPLFVNAAANDCHLKAGSPCINAGRKIPDITKDLDGNPRGAGGTGWDIGAYEYIAPTR